MWRAVPPRLPRFSLYARLAVMSVLSLTAWFFGAWLAVAALSALRTAHPQIMPIVGWGGTATLAVVGALACLGNPPAPRGSKPVPPTALILRGTLAAVAIGVAVVLAALGGATAAGIASVFPAIFITTMVSLWIAQGESVPAGAVGPMMLGAASVGAYACVAAWSLPLVGPALGATSAWLVAVLFTTVPAWLWLERRAR